MKPLNVLKFAVPLCLLLGFKAAGQAAGIKPQPFTKIEIITDMSLVSPINTPLAETKLQRRKRKKSDPILIPYRLNKKTLSLS